MICVFDQDNTNFEGNGNAILIPTVAKAKMVAGGNYELTMTHPIDPEGKWKHLLPDAIIRIPVPEEEIENAFSGYEADVYKTTGEAALREAPNEPTAITYQTWRAGGDYQKGSKVTVPGWNHKNYQCTYYDPASGQVMVPPYNSSWWREIPDKTAGAAVLVTLPAGTDLYFVEDTDATWYKMSTYYGVVGYIKKADVTYDRHLTPSETQPRIIREQLLRITNATVDTKNRTVSVTAQHVSYDLAGILVQEAVIVQASPAMAMGRIMEGLMVDYEGTIATNLTSDDNGTYTDTIKGKNGIYCLLDPDKGIVSKFDAAYKRDNWDIFIMKKVEVDRGFRLKYRKNLLGVNWAQKRDGLITRVVPVAKDEGGADLYLPEKWIDSPLINSYPRIRMERLTVKGQIGKDKGLGDDSVWTDTDLYAEMRTKAEERFTVDKADLITQEVTVDFEMIGDTEEYKELKGLEKVLLYDTVTVEDETVGLEMQLTVTEMEWDAIRKKVTALKLSNVNNRAGKNVTGYNVQAKSIGSDKLTDDVAGEILNDVKDIIPEYADPEAKTKVVDNLTSTSTTDALSANQGRVLSENKFDKNRTELNSSKSINDNTLFGIYYVNGATGGPTDLAYNLAYLLAFVNVQFLHELFGNHRIFSRYYANGAWDSWKQLSN